MGDRKKDARGLKARPWPERQDTRSRANGDISHGLIAREGGLDAGKGAIPLRIRSPSMTGSPSCPRGGVPEVQARRARIKTTQVRGLAAATLDADRAREALNAMLKSATAFSQNARLALAMEQKPGRDAKPKKR
ncbi:MAG: hypothetical protein IBJ10_02720 [Phycisphaerales bacterium]|nr:hypothetical protein [Phycisphaerales bacterium]